MRFRGLVTIVLLASALVGSGFGAQYARASDHDDGETDIKSRNTNLTDLYVFNEKSQNPQAQSDDLILVMNLNPRSIPRQQYFFNTNARYEFHVSRVTNNAETPTGKDDVILRYEFGEPDQNNQQPMTVSAIRDGQKTSLVQNTGAQQILTTPITQAPISNWVCFGDRHVLTVFAGTRQDPFFFDVEQFFRVRSSAVAIAEHKAPPSSQEVFRNPGKDFAIGYNVLSIVTRVPKGFFQGPTSCKTFDVWETISVRKTEVANALEGFPKAGQTPPVPGPGVIAPLGKPVPAPAPAKQ